jgi:hypothetical protein
MSALMGCPAPHLGLKELNAIKYNNLVSFPDLASCLVVFVLHVFFSF